MKSALHLRAALQDSVPDAIYRFPPEDVPRGVEGAVRILQPLGTLSDSVAQPRVPFDLDDEQRDESLQDLEEMFEFGPPGTEDAAALGQTEKERIRQAVLAKGVDALGWYAPFHAIGVQWGIYIPISSLAYVAECVFAGVAADLGTRVRLAFRIIHQHELFHFAAEYALAQFELFLRTPFHVERSRLRDPKLGFIVAEEQAANAWMLRSLRTAKRSQRPAGRAKALRHFISKQPPGYRDAPEILETHRFRAAVQSLVEAYVDSSECAVHTNLDWLYPLRPQIDWRQCPVHLIDDGVRLPFAPCAFDLFAQVSGITLTETFKNDLLKLPKPLRRAWEKVERMLAVSTALGGLNFKLWERRSDCRLYSVRVSDGCRAHLRYDEQSRWFAERIGTHAAMGHG